MAEDIKSLVFCWEERKEISQGSKNNGKEEFYILSSLEPGKYRELLRKLYTRWTLIPERKFWGISLKK